MLVSKEMGYPTKSSMFVDKIQLVTLVISPFQMLQQFLSDLEVPPIKMGILCKYKQEFALIASVIYRGLIHPR